MEATAATQPAAPLVRVDAFEVVWVSVALASLGFTIQYALGGTGGAPVSTVAAAMVGVHVLIGIGEGVITGLAVSAVLATRPDLVHGAADLAPDRPLHIGPLPGPAA